MTKEQADKIARDIIEAAYESFSESKEPDNHIEHHLECRISAALVDASKVTECAKSDPFQEWEKWHNKQPASGHWDSDKTDFSSEVFQDGFIAGQKSKALVLPERTASTRVAEEMFDQERYQYAFINGGDWMLQEIKRMNEGSK